MRYRHYTYNSPTYGWTLWYPESNPKKRTLDIYWKNHVFVFMLYKDN